MTGIVKLYPFVNPKENNLSPFYKKNALRLRRCPSPPSLVSVQSNMDQFSPLLSVCPNIPVVFELEAAVINPPEFSAGAASEHGRQPDANTPQIYAPTFTAA